MEKKIHKNIQAFLRKRPFLNFEKKITILKILDEQMILESKEHNNYSIQTKYIFDNIFDENVDNYEIAETAIYPLLQNCFLGFNGTILAFGQTCSGKTFSIFGDDHQKGILFYCVEYIFDWLKSNKHINGVIINSIYEIYNENIYDLLCDKNENISIGEKNDEFFVKNLTEKQILNVNQAFELFLLSNKRKTMGSSYLHDGSSRSHTIYRILIGIENTLNGEKSISELNLVDLAGSEYLGKDFNAIQLSENKNINTSLFCLKLVIDALSKKDKFIPYRNSLLTKILKNSLGGNAMTSILCMISPSVDHSEITKRTLKFGQKVQNCQNKIKINTIKNASNIIFAYKSNKGLGEEFKIKESDEKLKKKIDFKVSNQKEFEFKELKIEISFKENVIIHMNYFGEIKENSNFLLFLHAYGNECSGKDWIHIVKYFSLIPNLCIFCIDFPGFGKSSKSIKLSSRSESFWESQGPCEIIYSIFKYFEKYKNRFSLIGYDWGAGIALSLANSEKTCSYIDKIILFHCSKLNIDEITLKKIDKKVFILWVNQDQFHPVSFAEFLSKNIKNSTLFKINIRKFHSDKSKCYYKLFAELISTKMISFLFESYSQKNIENVVKDEPEVIDENEDEEKEISEKKLEKNENDLFTLMKQRVEIFAENYESPINKTGEKIIEKKEIIEKITIIKEFTDKNDKIKENIEIFKTLLFNNSISDFYKQFIFGGPLKIQAIKIFSKIPIFYNHMLENNNSDNSLNFSTNSTFSNLSNFQKYLENFKKWGIWDDIPKNIQEIYKFSQFIPFRQVFVKLPVHINYLTDETNNFLTFNENSKNSFITHKALILEEEDDFFIVGILRPNKNFDDDEKTIDKNFNIYDFEKKLVEKMKIIKILKNEIFKYNCGTAFENNKKKFSIIFEDGLKCKYDDLLTRAKLLESALAMRKEIVKIDFSHSYFEAENKIKIYHSQEKAGLLLKYQKKCVKRILQTIDLVHCVHEGINPKRFGGGNSIGKLAYFGQGNCHGLASTLAAFLLPFCKLVGLDFRFRHSFIVSKGRDINKDALERNHEFIGNNWDGYPKNIDDHTFIDLTYFPSLRSYVVDNSSWRINVPINYVYSKIGRVYILDKEKYENCETKKNDRVFVVNSNEIFKDNIEQIEGKKPKPLNWKKILK